MTIDQIIGTREAKSSTANSRRYMWARTHGTLFTLYCPGWHSLKRIPFPGRPTNPIEAKEGPCQA